MKAAKVKLWGATVGAVSWDPDKQLGAFQYGDSFLGSGIEIAPLTMPMQSGKIYQFKELSFQTYKGLPGLLADSLPDKFGNALIDQWLARQGRDLRSFSPVERLCYIGKRGMGALEFEPTLGRELNDSEALDISAMVELCSEILSERKSLNVNFSGENRKSDSKALADILAVGTSAGGARAKAIIAWNEQSGEIRSGQVTQPPGFGYWLLKFDGVSNNRDKEIADPKGYGRIEYAYYLMAKDAGITISPSRLLEERGRAHFMTRRFDRTASGEKLHLQSLCGLAHFDFNLARAYSYEQALLVVRELGLGMADLEEMFRRMTLNVVARNQDDHTKNIAFLMDKKGVWSLSPAFDITYSYNPTGMWTSQHQMSINGKTDKFFREDLLAVCSTVGMNKSRCDSIIEQIQKTCGKWLDFASEAKLSPEVSEKIGKVFRRF